jgi:predicted nucleic acid-binding protein
MKLYFDNCCFNRPYDDQTHEKIHLESEAVLAIIKLNKQNDGEIVGSPALDLEISQIKDDDKKDKVKSFYKKSISFKINYNENILKRVHELSEQSTIRTLDKFHLAFAENSGAKILFTTDVKFEKACSRLNLNIMVTNPVKYLMEETENDSN